MTVVVRPHGPEYYLNRGLAFHTLLAPIFRNPNWPCLANLKLRALRRELVIYARASTCPITRSAVDHEPTLAWLTAAYRHLLKCMTKDWGIRPDVLVEPFLPVVTLPNGKVLRCGSPDLHAWSDTFGGYINIELKTGFRRAKNRFAKVARYNSGAYLLRHDLAGPHRVVGTVWLCINDALVEKPHGRVWQRSWPVLSYSFDPFQMETVDEYLTRQFGVPLRTLKRLARHYEYPEASLRT